jgi:hypothetical protein
MTFYFCIERKQFKLNTIKQLSNLLKIIIMKSIFKFCLGNNVSHGVVYKLFVSIFSLFFSVLSYAQTYTANAYKLYDGGGFIGNVIVSPQSRTGSAIWADKITDYTGFRFGNNLDPYDFYVKRPINGATYPIFGSEYETSRLIGAGNLEFAGGNRGFENGSTAADMLIHKNGNVLIGPLGATEPKEKLVIREGNLKTERGNLIITDVLNDRDVRFVVETRSQRDRSWLGTTSNHMMSIGVNNIGVMDVFPDGNGYVTFFKNGGGINPNEISEANKNRYSVFVAGGILSEDFAIGPKSSWADQVFSTDYKLRNLNEVENYIQENNHLPDIPSAAEVRKNGYTLHDMNIKLLQKVEELTLYSIEQNKKIEQLEGVVKSYESLMEKVNQLESQINK